MAADAFDIYDAWDLLDTDERKLKRLNARDWRKIGEALEAVHTTTPAVAGSATPGLNQGVSIVEGATPLTSIGPHLLLFDLVWLPDPVFSLIAEEAHDVHRLLPDLGGAYFGADKPIHVDRKTVWSLPPVERLPFLRERFPALARRMRELRPFHRLGALGLYAWEPTVGVDPESLRHDTHALRELASFQEISQRHRQIDYNLGVFVGAIGIEVSSGAEMGLAPGTPMWLVDRTPVALYGLVNALVAARQGAALVPDRIGDHEVLTALATGTTNAQTTQVGPAFLVPEFSDATWNELPALRANSDALAELRAVVRRVATSPADAFDLADAIDASARRLREQASLWQLAGKDATEVGLNIAGGTAAGAAAGAALGGGSPLFAAAGALIGGAGGSLGTGLKILGRLGEYGRTAGKRGGAEILVRLARKIREA